jgi:hypothetical protein
MHGQGTHGAAQQRRDTTRSYGDEAHEPTLHRRNRREAALGYDHEAVSYEMSTHSAMHDRARRTDARAAAEDTTRSMGEAEAHDLNTVIEAPQRGSTRGYDHEAVSYGIGRTYARTGHLRTDDGAVDDTHAMREARRTCNA